MHRKIPQIFIIVSAIAFILLGNPARAMADGPSEEKIEIKATLPAYASSEDKEPAFWLYRGMEIKPQGADLRGKDLWIKFEAGNRDYWIKGIDKGQKNYQQSESEKKGIIDSYGILDMPHQYAVKLVKKPEAKGAIETYKKINGKYVFQYSYEAAYPKEGPKSVYGDLKTVGGPIIRYMYRTTRSGMNGRDREGSAFGVYKISYPMPHDALPYFLEGKMGTAGYNKIPAINEKNGQYFPHPHSAMGADILIHTGAKGSLGCINVANEAMAFLYEKDLVSANDREIIPLIIYDEDNEAPSTGELF